MFYLTHKSKSKAGRVHEVRMGTSYVRSGLRIIGLFLSSLLLLSGIINCKRENESFDPRQKYNEEIRSFDRGSEDRLPYLVGKDFQPVWKRESIPNKARKVPGFAFTDQDQASYGSENLKGDIYLANFFFTECNGICPMTMPRLRQVQKDIGDLRGIKLISFSVTPDVDTPQVMKDYAGRLGIDQSNWHLLTGDRESIYTLARETFGADTMLKDRKSDQDFLHSEEAFLVDQNGYLRGIYNVRGSGDLERLVGDIRLLHSQN
ncbi:MAG: SCO family protein [Leptospiraceae bacterium]|nr:SCO family protein [Leptospiraceae bacterium]